MLFNKKASIQIALAAFCLTLVTVFQFHQISDTHRIMETGDSPPSRAHDQKANLHGGFVMGWNPYSGTGAPGEVAPPDWQSLIYLFVPEMKAAEYIMAIALILASLFFYLFLKERGYSRMAALIGGTVFGFSPSLSTFTYAGHVGRFVMMAYMGGAFWATQRAVQKTSIPAALWAGLFMAYAMMNDGTTGLLMLIGLALLVLRDLLEIWRNSRPTLLRVGVRLSILGAVAIMAIAPQASYLKAALSDGADIHANTRSPEEQWEWATQWSLPPQELLAFISAGYYGLDSWNDHQPYWGRLGRSFGWENSHQGFRNFSQTNAYLGLIPFILLTTGLILNSKRIRSKTLHDGQDAPTFDTLFWLLLGGVSLLTAFGRYFPTPFHIFTSLPLPLIGSFRNPVKFLVLINLCTAVLAAQGVEALVSAGSTHGNKASDTKSLRCLSIVAAAFTILFAFIMMTAPWSKPAFQNLITSIGMQEQGRLIVASMRASLMTGLGWSLLIAILAGVATIPGMGGISKKAIYIPILLFVLIAFDFIGVNRRYIRYEDVRVKYADNAILSDLRAFPDFRVHFVPPTFPLFQLWDAQQSRLNGIRSLDGEGPPTTLLPFMTAIQHTPERLADLLGVRHMVIPRQYTNLVTGMLGVDAIELKGYSVNQRMSGQMEIAPTTPGAGYLALIDNPSAYALPKWYAKAQSATEQDVLPLLSDSSFDPNTTLLVEAPANELDRFNAAGSGEARYILESFTHNRIQIKGAASQPGWLMINEPYHDAWKAEIDGKPAPIRKAFGVLRAVPVDRGEHTVTLTYSPRTTMFWVPLIMLGGATIVSIGSLCIGTAKKAA